MKSLRIFLRDYNPALVEAWREQFEGQTRVDVSRGDIFDILADAIVSPANSFGYMDGGIDLAYVHELGWELQSRLQERLREDYYGELPVGQAVVIPTGHDKIRYLVSAPTMRVPMDVSDTVNAYLAFRAALIAIETHNKSNEDQIGSVMCPGLGTAVGQMAPDTAALQMAAAYRVCALGEQANPRNHLELLNLSDAHRAE